MLRKNKDTGAFERLVDGNWVPAPDVEDTGDLEPHGTAPSAVGVAEQSAEHDRVDWNSVERMFQENVEPEGRFAEGDDAPGSNAPGSHAGGDLAVPEPAAESGSGQVVQVPEGPGPEGQGPGQPGSGQLAALEPQAVPSDGTEQADLEVELGIDEIPGLTTADKKTGVTGQRGVLQKLRDRRRGARNTGQNGPERKSESGRVKGTTRTPPSGRSVQRVEVAETNARPRGPAVKDGTESRQKAREAARTKPEAGGRISTKPSPEIVSDMPRWARDLFEAHFRSSRTLELRHMPIGKSGKNRMKMSRADFAIGWRVLLEAARRSPEILHIKEVDGQQ